jgi:hypothetical protein
MNGTDELQPLRSTATSDGGVTTHTRRDGRGTSVE